MFLGEDLLAYLVLALLQARLFPQTRAGIVPAESAADGEDEGGTSNEGDEAPPGG